MLSPLAGALRRGQEQGPGAGCRLTTLSGLDVALVYGPPAGLDYPGFGAHRLAWEFPYTRGLHATGYRGKPWTIRQFAGFGNARQTNEPLPDDSGVRRRGLSVAFDMPTLMGRDSDDPLALGEVGHRGVAIDSAADMDLLFDSIPLGTTTTSMTISARRCRSSPCMSWRRSGRDSHWSLDGTLQTDIC